MATKNILIIGTGDLRNYGCEAIIHGTHAIIQQTLTDYDLYVASDNKDYDAIYLPPDIHLIKYRQRFTFHRIWRGILRRLFHFGNGSPVLMNRKIGKKFDFVLSCGGDNYSEAPDGTLSNILTDLVTVGENTVNYHRKFILWGASVGPFSKANESCIIKNLQKSSLICVREPLSYNYLKQFHFGKKLQLVADPAFMMPPDTSVRLKREKHSVYIGINISRLSIVHTIKDDKERKDFTNRLFLHLDYLLIHHPDWHFVCIPHVVIPNDFNQNDYLFMQQFLSTTRNKKQVSILPPDIGAKATKGYISQLDLLIAARMHCCVAGISTAVPTIFVTYSNKGIGIAQYAYGHHDFDIPVPSLLSPDFESIIIRMVNNREQIKAGLKAKQALFTKDAMKAGEYLSTMPSKFISTPPTD